MILVPLVSASLRQVEPAHEVAAIVVGDDDGLQRFGAIQRDLAEVEFDFGELERDDGGDFCGEGEPLGGEEGDELGELLDALLV